jgi:hypothetical protein
MLRTLQYVSLARARFAYLGILRHTTIIFLQPLLQRCEAAVAIQLFSTTEILQDSNVLGVLKHDWV